MQVYLRLRGHANTVPLPLRLGLKITESHQQFARLDPYWYDEEGTRGQRQTEIDEGRKHYRGCLRIPHEDPNNSGDHQLDCRVILGAPNSPEQRPPIITILRSDNNKGDLTVTRHLEGMLKKGKITSEDLIEIFHPAYRRGELLSSNDCEEVYDREIRPKASVASSNDPTAESLLRIPNAVVEAMEGTPDEEDRSLRAPLSFKDLPIPDVKFEYVMADAFIWNVRVEDLMIKFTCINSRGLEQEMHSFKSRPHLAHLHDYAFRYLKDREEQRAMFAICNSEPCRGFLAESVTAIALQMMRAGVGSKE